jgi:hypothetical protein
MMIDVYHSGRGKRVVAPFVLVPAGMVRLPPHPGGARNDWNYWKRVPLQEIALVPSNAERAIRAAGFFVQ